MIINRKLFLLLGEDDEAVGIIEGRIGVLVSISIY